MLLTPSLPLLPPPPSSLLPSLSPSDAHTHTHSHAHHPHHPHHQHRRQKHVANPRSTLSILAADERNIVQRKLAIAMYGYSWLKPAGCAKTMLGRREEEIEREEVERQLREVEMQERMAVEAEEQERLARLREGGEPEEGRDLDDDVPEAEEGETQMVDEGEGMEGDLDDDIPEAEDDDDEAGEGDVSAVQQGWTYDTNVDPDSDEEIGVRQAHFATGVRQGRARAGSDFGDDERAAQELVDQMLNEDEIGEMEFDHEDDIGGATRNLDDDVPEADEGGWEHTDSELEESEMDISLLPGQQHLMPAARRSSGFPQTGRRSGGRVISGNATLNMQAAQQRLHQMQTPQFSSDMLGAESHGQQAQSDSAGRRSWLQAAGARRNLFGIGRNQQNTSSGRFFTPSPAQAATETSPGAEEGQTPRRSGRFLGRRREARENRDSID